MKILIAGGAGFIGSTIASAATDAGMDVVLLDDLSAGRREFARDLPFYEGDIADGDLVDRVFIEHPDIDAAVDCAALIVVPDSVTDPLGYYNTNVGKGVAFLQHLARNGCERLLFSSSASIYEAPDGHPAVDESSPIRPLSPYATTKAMFETVLADTAAAGILNVISLRYFNPIGADPQLRTGLQIRTPTHALGAMITAHHTGGTFSITGTDWPTRDGSGIRDYVHVWDLAQAHVAALQQFDKVTADKHAQAINLGTGDGTTVLELITAFNEVTGRTLPTRTTAARPGDSAGAYTSSTRAHDLLGWSPRRTLQDGIRDSLAWYDKRDTILTD